MRKAIFSVLVHNEYGVVTRISGYLQGGVLISKALPAKKLKTPRFLALQLWLKVMNGSLLK